MLPVISPAFVGRAQEMARLKDYLAESLQDKGRLVFVSGEAGIGKSRLVAEFVDYARAEGVRVLTGRAGHAGAPTPFRPFVETFQSALDPHELRHPSIEHFRAQLERLIGLRTIDAEIEETSALAAMEGILRLLRVISMARGLLLVIEDVQSADRDTLGTIEYISDKLEGHRILCVATDRSDLDVISGDLITSLVARRAAERIELRPLPRDEVDAFARAALRSEAIPSSLLDVLDRRAAGIPFLIEELLGAYVDAGGTKGSEADQLVSGPIVDRIPFSYREVVRERLDSLDEHARVVTFAAAVVGRSFDPKLLPSITGLSEEEVKAGLRTAIRGNVLSAAGDHFAPAYGFRHALARESILAELLPEERAALSKRAARAIENLFPELPGEWCERASNLYEQGRLPREAARILQESARRALTRSALQSAESALLHARTLVVSDWMMWMAIDDLLLDVYSHSGRIDGLLDQGRALITVYVQRYGADTVGPRIAKIHLKIARGMLAGADWRTAEAHLRAAAEIVESGDETSLSSEISALSARSALASGKTVEAERHARRAVTASVNKPAGSRCDALDALAAASLERGELEESREAWTRVLTLAQQPKLAVWRVRALLGLGMADVMETGDTSRLMSARTLALEVGALAPYAAIELQTAWAYLARPDIVTAGTHLARCWELIRLHDLRIVDEATAAQCMLLALGQDRHQLQELKERTRSEPLLEASMIGNGDAVLAVVDGDDSAALGHLDAAAALLPRTRREWWAGLGVLLAIAERGGELPTHDDGGVTTAKLPIDRAYMCFARAVMEGRRGDDESADAAMARADLLMPPGWRRHHARRVVADAALEAGWGDPGKWAGEAIEFFDQANMPGLVAGCRATLRKAGVPVRRRGRGQSQVPTELRALGVTSREMDVLHLVADRLSNRDIAERLFVSPRTIETHVSSLQRKTQTSSRPELIEFARRRISS